MRTPRIISVLSTCILGITMIACTREDEEDVKFPCFWQSFSEETLSDENQEMASPAASCMAELSDTIKEVFPTFSAMVNTNSDEFMNGSTIVSVLSIRLSTAGRFVELDVKDLNPDIAELGDESSLSHFPRGVTMEKKPLLKEGIFPFVLQVGTMPTVNYTIRYVVRTKDERLGDGWTECMNREDGVITFPHPICHDVQYDLLLIIHLDSIMFSASVEQFVENG